MSTPGFGEGRQREFSEAPYGTGSSRDSGPSAASEVPLQQFPNAQYGGQSPQPDAFLQQPAGGEAFGTVPRTRDGDATGPIPVVRPGAPPLHGSVSGGPPAHKHSRAGAAWVALVVAAVVLVFLLIFVGQNSGAVQVRYLGFEGTMPLGVAMAFAAVAGALTAALLGTVRIIQLRARARRAGAER